MSQSEASLQVTFFPLTTSSHKLTTSDYHFQSHTDYVWLTTSSEVGVTYTLYTTVKTQVEHLDIADLIFNYRYLHQ